jgi:hypothetical protein
MGSTRRGNDPSSASSPMNSVRGVGSAGQASGCRSRGGRGPTPPCDIGGSEVAGDALERSDSQFLMAEVTRSRLAKALEIYHGEGRNAASSASTSTTAPSMPTMAPENTGDHERTSDRSGGAE